MALTKPAIDTTSRVCDTQSGYLWYICTWTTPYYSGCCRVDPCKRAPVGCPPSARDNSAPTPTASTSTSTISATLTDTETFLTSHSPASTSLSPTLGVSPPTSPTIPPTTPAEHDPSNSSGITLSVSALVGIVVGCGLVGVFAALTACMWWRRRRRDKDEKRQQGERPASSRGQGDEQIPSGLESVFNPMTQGGRGSVFDRAEGRMGNVDSMLGLSPLAHGTHMGRLSSGAQSGLVSPITPNSVWESGLPSSPSELDSTPIHGGMSMSMQQNGTAGSDSRYGAREELEGRPRATLNPTQQEREAGMYANSWTKFQNVQL